MEQLEKQDKTVRKLKKQLKVFAKKIGELEGTFIFWEKMKDIFFFCDPVVIISICLSGQKDMNSLAALACVNWLQKQKIHSELSVFLYKAVEDLS